MTSAEKALLHVLDQLHDMFIRSGKTEQEAGQMVGQMFASTQLAIQGREAERSAGMNPDKAGRHL